MTKADWRLVVLFLHVLGAVVALGFSLTYGLWIALADAAGGDRRTFTLHAISWIDRRFTTPAYVLQAVTGVILVLLVDLDLFREAWLVLAIAIYVLLTVVAITSYAPAHRQQAALADALARGDAVEAEYGAAARRARSLGVAVVTLTLVILGLMVVKPPLWD